MMVAYLKQSLESYYNVHKASIENYDKWKINCKKEEYLKILTIKYTNLKIVILFEVLLLM